MSDKIELSEKAKENAKKAAERLFGNRTKEQEKALKKNNTTGDPKNLADREKSDDDC